MMDKITAANGAGPCVIFTASGVHLSVEAVRERKGIRDIGKNTPLGEVEKPKA
ncbi:MAG: hypothetical protein FWG31_09700 [Oscillospiraceae bacterium]|nr:hypothetical protein [Oscillospiraceae bacterium]